MKFKYVNSKGETVDFSDFPYLFQDGNLLDYAWNYETVENSNKVFNFNRKPVEKTFQIAVVPDFDTDVTERREKLKNAVNRIFEVLEFDVLEGVDGKLYCGEDMYLPCRISASTKSDWNKGIPFMFQEFTAVSAKGCWLKEVKKSFTVKQEQGTDEMLDYPYDYEYNFATALSGTEYWSVSKLSFSDFVLTIYGSAVNPTIYINSEPYSVFVTLESNEYLTVDSRTNEVVKHTDSGDISVYDLRGKEHSVFSKIPNGDLLISWNGSFGFDIVAFAERSEPEWT